jgi:hypothetical protein
MNLESFTFVTNMYISLSATPSQGHFKAFRAQKKRNWVALWTCNPELTLQIERLLWMKTVKSICISDFKDHSDSDNGRLFYTCYVRIYIQKCTWPKSDTQQAFWMSHAAAWMVMALSWQFIIVMSAVALMNYDESTIQYKKKPSCYTSSKSCMRIHYLTFA